MGKVSAFIGVKVEPELHSALKEYARGRGGVSKVLRDLIDREFEAKWKVAETLPDPEPAPAPALIRITLRPEEQEAVQHASGRKGMSPSQWIKAMIRSLCLDTVALSPDETRAWQEVAKAIRGFSSELRSLDAPSATAAARALNTQVLRMIADAIQGNLSYWRGEAEAGRLEHHEDLAA